MDISNLLTVGQSNNFKLEVSGPLKNPTDNPLWQWLEKISETSALLGGILFVMHPELYHMGMEAWKSILNSPDIIKESELVLELLTLWMSPFSGMSVISNRETILHRDVKSRHEWYDLLLTLGDYSDGRLEVPGLGIRVTYNPGSVVGIAGKVLRHGVAACKGNRVCLAYFMRQKVLERLGVAFSGYSKYS
jgi:hypothetical protein